MPAAVAADAAVPAPPAAPAAVAAAGAATAAAAGAAPAATVVATGAPILAPIPNADLTASEPLAANPPVALAIPRAPRANNAEPAAVAPISTKPKPFNNGLVKATILSIALPSSISAVVTVALIS